MRHFLYYLPGLQTPPTEALIKSEGLAPSVGDGCRSRGTDSGPDSTAGQVVAPAGEAGIGYWPDRQTWMKCGSYWIGWENGKQPGPEDLKREELIEGEMVKMGDGREWLIPMIRSTIRGTCLPQGLVLNEEGEWSPRPMKVYQELSADAERLWEWFELAIVGDESLPTEADKDKIVQASTEELADIVCHAMSVNYKVARSEVSALGLLNDFTIVAACRAIVDWASLVKMGKALERQNAGKQEAPTSDTPSTDVGAKGSSPTISPPLPT